MDFGYGVNSIFLLDIFLVCVVGLVGVIGEAFGWIGWRGVK